MTQLCTLLLSTWRDVGERTRGAKSWGAGEAVRLPLCTLGFTYPPANLVKGGPPRPSPPPLAVRNVAERPAI